MPGPFTSQMLQLIGSSMQQQAAQDAANRQQTVEGGFKLLENNIIPPPEMVKAIEKIMPGFAQVVQQAAPQIQQSRQQAEQAAKFQSMFGTDIMKLMDMPTPRQESMISATAAERGAQSATYGGGEQAATPQSRLATLEAVREQFPLSTAMTFGPQTLTAATNQAAQTVEAGLAPIREQTALLKAKIAQAEVALLPEKLKVDMLQMQTNLEAAQARLQSALATKDTASITQETARIKQGIEQLKAAVAQEANTLAKQFLTQTADTAQQTLDTVEQSVSVGPSGVTVSQQRKPFEVEAAREAISAELYNKRYGQITTDERSIVNMLKLEREKIANAAGQPLPAEITTKLAAENVLIERLNDIRRLYSPLFTGPVVGRFVALQQMIKDQPAAFNRLVQSLNRLGQVSASAQTGAQRSFAEMQNLMKDLAKVSNRPSLFLDLLAGTMRETLQSRKALIQSIGFTRGNIKESDMAQPIFESDLPEPPQPQQEGRLTQDTPEMAKLREQFKKAGGTDAEFDEAIGRK